LWFGRLSLLLQADERMMLPLASEAISNMTA
jgi:hypothetical protein